MATPHWSEGYATATGYTHQYYADLNPQRAAFLLLLEGLDGPPPGPCCELGFGQGLSLAMHAAGDPSRRWWGNDFMPDHAAQAQRLMDAAGCDGVVSDQSFEDFFARSDLPQFAFVALHGVWSWVSAANRERIVGFLRRHLMPGGVLYIGWNTLPGWAPLLPLRELMLQHMRRAGAAGASDAVRVQAALAYAQRLLAHDGTQEASLPILRARLADLATKPATYVLHELLNEDWHPMSFAQTAAELDAARLSYAGSSELHYRFADAHFSAAQQAELASTEDLVLREMARDLMLGARFRREYWVRGRRPLARTEVAQRLRAQRVVLAAGAHEVPGVVHGPHADITLDRTLLGAVLVVLERAGGPLALGPLLDDATLAGRRPDEVLDLLAALIGTRAVHLAAPLAQEQAAQPFTQRLNAHLCGPHAHRLEIRDLASPVTGGGVPVPASLQLMLAARQAAPEQPERWAGLLLDAMQAEGQQMMKDQQVVSDRATALSVLQPMVQQMQDQSLPALRRLGVA